MDHMFKGMKYRVNPRFFSQTQPDGEEIAPGANNPSYLPDLLSVKKSDAAQQEARKKKVDAQSNKDADGGSKVDWLTKLSKEEKKRKIEAGIELKSKKPKKSKIKPGAYVYTLDMRIAVKSKTPKQGGKRRYRHQCKGTVMKASAYYHKVWVVKFDDGRTLSCSEALLIFISKTSPTHRLVRDGNNELSLEKIDRDYEDKEAILDVILNSKIHRTNGHDQVTYENLVQLFKPQHTWLTASKLRKHVSVKRRFLAINKESQSASNQTGTWLSELPDPNVEEHNDKNDDDTSNNKSVTGTSTKFAGRNHGGNEDAEESGDDEDYCDDNVENHGLACTCCGTRSNVITDSDLKQLQATSLKTGNHAMIVRVVRSIDGSNRTCTIKTVPESSSHVDSDDTETKHTKYVSNGYTTIDSDDEAVGTSEEVDNIDDDVKVGATDEEGDGVFVDNNNSDDTKVGATDDEGDGVFVDNNDGDGTNVGVTDGDDDGVFVGNDDGDGAKVDDGSIGVGRSNDNPIVFDTDGEVNEGQYPILFIHQIIYYTNA